MNILVVGAGAVSSVILKYLSKDKKVSEIVCGYRNIKRAKEFVNIKNHKIKLEKLDASNLSSIVKIAKNVDLIINASLPDFNEKIMKAALKVGTNYQDLCSLLLDFKNPEQLKFNKQFQKEKIIGLINTGISPGVTNLLAREAADKLDVVYEIKIRAIEDQSSSRFIFSWSPKNVFDEFATPPLIYKNNKFKFAKPFGDIEEYKFPYPFGNRYVFNIYGDEVSTIPFHIKTRNINFKAGGKDIEILEYFYELGLFNRKPLLFHKQKIIPLEFFSNIIPSVPSPREMTKLLKNGVIKNAVFTSIVEVIGKRADKKIKIKYIAKYPDLRKISKIFSGATYISYPAGMAAIAFCKVIPKIDTYGVFPPEAIGFKIRKDILTDLKNKGIIINKQILKYN